MHDNLELAKLGIIPEHRQKWNLDFYIRMMIDVIHQLDPRAQNRIRPFEFTLTDLYLSTQSCYIFNTVQFQVIKLHSDRHLSTSAIAFNSFVEFFIHDLFN